MILVVVFAATGCPEVSPPPAPTILSANLTPTVVAGQAITADVVASHPSATVNRMDIQVSGPGGATLPYDVVTNCHTELTFQPVTTSKRIDATTTESSLTCVVPAYATNGIWTAVIWVDAGSYKPATMTMTFEVTGGTAGPADPVITMVTPPPTSAARGSRFPIEYQIDDVALGPLSIQEPTEFLVLSSDRTTVIGIVNCGQPVTTHVSPSEVDIVRTCAVGATLPTGVYTASLSVDDLLGFQARTDLTFTVI
jgi:hypothetical protein